MRELCMACEAHPSIRHTYAAPAQDCAVYPIASQLEPMFRFTIRDVLWLTVLAAVGLCWLNDRGWPRLLATLLATWACRRQFVDEPSFRGGPISRSTRWERQPSCVECTTALSSTANRRRAARDRL